MHYAGRVPVKIAYFVSHPIQYQAPLLRRIAREPDIELTTYFFSDFSVKGYADEGFGGVRVQWDIALLDGYVYEFLPGVRKDVLSFAAPLNYGIYSRLHQGRFDAVWLHGYHTLNSLHVLMAAKALGIPVLLRTDSSPDDRVRNRVKLVVKRLFFMFLRRMVRGVLTTGDKNAQYWRAALGPTFPLFLMPYAVDNDFFRERAKEAAPQRERLRGTMGLKPGLPIFLYASKLQRRKRCIDLVEAFLRLSSGTEPKAYLLIAGDGEERAAVEQRIRESGASNIRMLGFQNQSELPRLFDICDVFVLPSIHEPWGLIVNEVMNAGRAVVVSDQVGCAPDLVHDGENGFVFQARNIEALTAALRRFLGDRSLAARMGVRSAEMISEYSFEQNVEGLRSALAFVVPGSGK